MNPIISIIIPTWNNPDFLNPCVSSIVKTGILNNFAELIIVNNGKQPCEKEFSGIYNLRVITSKENLGWEGGLKLGLSESSSAFVVFQNDDTHIPFSSSQIYEKLLWPFQDKSVAAVAPTTTCAAGPQSIYHFRSPYSLEEVPYLIFYTVMIRRSYLEEVGGIDETLPGGDDIDLSIRFRKAGKRILINPAAFLIHHGFKTGERVKGLPNVSGGWNSHEMIDRTNQALIRKHGFKSFYEAVAGWGFKGMNDGREIPEGIEKTIIKSFVNGSSDILEIGCGSDKLFENSTGIDIIPKGERIKNHMLRISKADIAADVTKPLPIEDESYDCLIASHILEHCLDPIDVISNWKKALRPGGRLIISVPNEEVTNGIPLDPEHCHAYSTKSLRNLLSILGFKEIETKDSGNGISLVGCYEKMPVYAQSL